MVNNKDPNSQEEDKKNFRFAHLYRPEPKNYNLEITFPKMMFDKKEAIDFLSKEGLL